MEVGVEEVVKELLCAVLRVLIGGLSPFVRGRGGWR